MASSGVEHIPPLTPSPAIVCPDRWVSLTCELPRQLILSVFPFLLCNPCPSTTHLPVGLNWDKGGKVPAKASVKVKEYIGCPLSRSQAQACGEYLPHGEAVSHSPCESRPVGGGWPG